MMPEHRQSSDNISILHACPGIYFLFTGKTLEFTLFNHIFVPRINYVILMP